ncbi:hypothetical protein HT031_004999 [Scenedesmus sp. PABB004]|nr:hypothetical protein HT031_004999 [Scenedesmus sp. PABB004]
MPPAAAADGGAEGDAGDGDSPLEHRDTVYERLPRSAEAYPDYEDEEWVSRVTNWESFWYEDEDVLDLEEGGLSPLEAARASLARARALAGQLSDLHKRADVEQMIAPRVRPTQGFEDMYTTEEQHVSEMEMNRLDPNPDWDAVDARALAEKRRRHALLDAEWERQKALLARPTSFTLRLDNDARLQGADKDWIREEWTHEQIMDLIVGGGKFVHPDKVPGVVLNPLLPADYAAAGVRAVPDTEEFLAAIGHLATEDEIGALSAGVALGEADFADPGLVFEDADGTLHAEAPPNPWAQRSRARTSSDVALFEALVDRLAAKQAARAARADAEPGDGDAAAAAAAADAGVGPGADEGGGGRGLDDLMGEGFTAFMEDDPSVTVYYDDNAGEDGGGEDGEDEGEWWWERQQQQQQQGGGA